MTLRHSTTRPTKTRSTRTPPRTGLPALVASHPLLMAAAASALALATSACVNARLVAVAERRNPPKGKFVRVKGLHLHYVEQGKGERWFSCRKAAYPRFWASGRSTRFKAYR